MLVTLLKQHYVPENVPMKIVRTGSSQTICLNVLQHI